MEEPIFEIRTDLSELNDAVNAVRQQIKKIIVGQDDMVRLIITALLADGHVLIEGVPGVAKTLTAKLVAKCLAVQFSRIQFTPDLMPSDVLGTPVFNPTNGTFEFKKGPLFSNIVLIDEINRAPAKTQAALFEVMEERQITVDGKTYAMQAPFMVIATQNPIEQEGTYKLPEAQLDRFIFRIKVNYPKLEEEIQILSRFSEDFSLAAIDSVKPVFTRQDIETCRAIIEKIYIKEDLLNYIAKIIHATRNNANLFLGASPRASLAILKASKAVAALNGRNYVIPDDV